jgi:metal-responsive CopG/Arc/MetJ family transcriptional regulator
MKIAISIPDHLCEEMNRLAKRNKTTRSQVFRWAVEEYLERVRSQRLLEALNSAYAGKETASEKRLRKRSMEHYAGAILQEGTDDDQAG